MSKVGEAAFTVLLGSLPLAVLTKLLLVEKMFYFATKCLKQLIRFHGADEAIVQDLVRKLVMDSRFNKESNIMFCFNR